MFRLDEPVLRDAVWALASAGPHPDLFGSRWGQVEARAEAVLRSSLRWSSSEIARLLGLVGEGGFTRGSFGQHVLQLLIRDPDHKEALRQVAVTAGECGDDDVASWALILSVTWAGEQGRSQRDELMERCPELTTCWAAPLVDGQLRSTGFVTVD